MRTRPAPPTKMKKQDGTRCHTPEENAEVFRDHFEQLYGRQPTFEWSVLDDIPQQPTIDGLDVTPTADEISKAVRRLKATAPGLSGLKAPAWRSLLDNEDTFSELKAIVIEVWDEEKMPSEWESGLLAVLPKKGDLSLPGNHRGIMMLEVAYKAVAIIMHDRLSPTCEKLDHESQCGFRPKRGTQDGIFTLKLALKKRREHGLESWVYFLDLVKAFDRVPRELLWVVLAKLGVAPKLIRVLKILHAVVKVRFNIDGIEVVLDSIIGVKQGDILGPILFVLFIAAIKIAWHMSHKYNLCVYRSKPDWVLHGRSHKAGRRTDEFAVPESMYADDTAVVFCSRRDVEEQCPQINHHFFRFGMEVHAGRDGKSSKSEILFVAAPGIMYVDASTYSDEHRDGVVRPRDLSDVDVGNGSCPIVDHFKYLGSTMDRNLRDARDVDERIKKAGAAFAALSKCVFSSQRVEQPAKRAVYVSLILAILLYGCEAWCLTELIFNRLRNFHNQCVRRMHRMSRKHQWAHRISDESLRLKLGLESIDEYIGRRQLSWAGHVARMSFDRLPRKLLSSWVAAPRPPGAPQFTYARGLHKALWEH